MKGISSFILVAVVCLAGVVSANVTDVELRAGLYQLGLLDSADSVEKYDPPGHVCFPQNITECIVFVAGSYPNQDQRLKAARACSGNLGQECVKFVSGSYPNFDERVESAEACKGNLGTDCATFVAGSYPTHAERTQAAEACRLADVECVRQVAGSYPTFADRTKAAMACGGQ